VATVHCSSLPQSVSNPSTNQSLHNTYILGWFLPRVNQSKSFLGPGASRCCTRSNSNPTSRVSVCWNEGYSIGWCQLRDLPGKNSSAVIVAVILAVALVAVIVAVLVLVAADTDR
jgi:hypothetical protein